MSILFLWPQNNDSASAVGAPLIILPSVKGFLCSATLNDACVKALAFLLAAVNRDCCFRSVAFCCFTFIMETDSCWKVGQNSAKRHFASFADCQTCATDQTHTLVFHIWETEVCESTKLWASLMVLLHSPAHTVTGANPQTGTWLVSLLSKRAQMFDWQLVDKQQFHLCRWVGHLQFWLDGILD